MAYKDLSMRERAALIKVGVQNGLTTLDDIEKAYNEYACGGHLHQTGGINYLMSFGDIPEVRY